MKTLFAFILPVAVCACAADPQNEFYHFEGASPLILTSTNHLHGYTRTDCFACHLPQNIHQVDRLHEASFSQAQFLVEQNGLLSCSGCHGTNGVSP